MFHPITIFILLFLAFILAGGPARAGGFDESMRGVGGSSGVYEPVPTIMNKETLSSNNIQFREPVTATGTIVAKDDSTIVLQTVNGKQNLAITRDMIVKRDGEMVSADQLDRGDIVAVTTNGRGEILGIYKESGILSSIKTILLFLGIGLISGAVAAKSFAHDRTNSRFELYPKKYI